MSRQAQSAPPTRTAFTSPSLTLSPPSPPLPPRIHEALSLITLPPAQLTHYVLHCLTLEVCAYDSQEWEEMSKAWKSKMLMEVVKDARRVEGIKRLLEELKIGKERVREIVADVADAANERIERERVSTEARKRMKEVVEARKKAGSDAKSTGEDDKGAAKGEEGGETLYSRRKGTEDAKLEVQVEKVLWEESP